MNKHFNTKLLALLVLLVCSQRGSAAVTTGTYTIGTGADYGTLTAAITDLNSSTITGPVTFNILPGTYSGTGWAAQINAISGSSATNRVTIQAQNGPGTVTISGAGTSSANYMIQLNGASYVSIKGLRISNTGTTYGRIIDFVGTASNDSVTGCVLAGATGSTSATGRALVGTAANNAMTNNVIFRDTLQNGAYGIYWPGTASTGSAGHVFSNNVFTNSYTYYIYTSYVGGAKIDNNTLTCTGISGYQYGIYNEYPVNGISVSNNTMNSTNTGGYLYGIYIYYGNYYTQTAPELKVDNNTLTLNGNQYIYGINMDYYCFNMSIKNNVLNTTTTSSYNYAVRVYYYCANLNMLNNTINSTNTGGSYNYPLYTYYLNYGVQTGTYANIKNNTINAVQQGTSGYIYSLYNYYNYNMNFSDNVINANSAYYIYNYGPFYNAFTSVARNNIFNLVNTGTGYTYNYAANVYNSSSTIDTFENNTINMSATSSASIANYICYYIPTGSIQQNNTYNVNVLNGTAYNYSMYGNGGLIKNNKFNATSTSGAIYGNYHYNYSSYSGAYWQGNTFDMNSTAGGTIYGFGGYYPGQDKFMSNVFVAKTTGATYMWYEPSGQGNQSDVYFFNNTFHSNSTGTTNYLVYKQGGSTSYPGVTFMYNNIFSKSSGSNTNGVYINDTTYIQSDYNLYYSPSAFNFQKTVSPIATVTSMAAWRAATKRDMNSLIYDPAYTDAANKNFAPLASSPNSWSLQGRGNHQPADTFDFAGNPRPKTRQQGVPDIGAYEFTPTSTPPDCIANPASPVASTTQTFTFGEDTVATIAWGASVPTTATMKQYTGLQAPSPMPASVARGYEYITLNTGSSKVYTHTPKVFYKNPWIGNISTETNTKIARISSTVWEGYNFGNTIIDSNRNTLAPHIAFDTTGNYTFVENARIGIRCVVDPQGLRASNVTATTADINWEAVFLPIGYQVLTDQIPGTPTSGAGASFATTNSFSVTALTENTEYYIHVRSICNAKDTSGWSTIKIKTLITCHAPEIKLATLSQQRAIVYWDTIQTAYKYEYTVTHDANPPAFGTTIYTNQQFMNIQPNTEYYIWVKAYCNSIYPSSDWGMLKFQTFPTSVTNANVKGATIAVYPNPASDVLHVTVANRAAHGIITVTDVTGKVLMTQAVDADEINADVRQLAKGMYILKYSDDANSTMMKFNKM